MPALSSAFVRHADGARPLNSGVIRKENSVDSLRLKACVFLAVLYATASVAAEPEPFKDDLVREFMKIIPPDTFTNTQTFAVNGFDIESTRYKQLGVKGEDGLSFNGKEIETVFVTAPGVLKAAVEKGVPPTIGGGVVVFHRDSGAPLANLMASTGDGALSYMEYSNADASGKVVMTVIDYEADGQADFRMNFAKGYNEIWHIDRWYKVEKRDGATGIVLNGAFIALKREKNRYVVP
jgi:hypothetical protein